MDNKKIAKELHALNRDYNMLIEQDIAQYGLKIEAEAVKKDQILNEMGGAIATGGAEIFRKYLVVGQGTETVRTGLDRNLMNESLVKNFTDDMNLYMSTIPEIAGKAGEEKDKIIKSMFAGLLLDAIKATAKVKPGVAEKVSRGVLLEFDEGGSVAAFALMESATVRGMFKAAGVSDTQIECITGLLGHAAWVEHHKHMTAGGGRLPNLEYTDEGIMSRAFNYARGMVGGHYLAVEAGFRIMRNHNLSMLDWMLNSKEAADYLWKVIEGKEKTLATEATTFADRMQGWIVRELAKRNERVDQWDAIWEHYNLPTFGSGEEEKKEDD